MFDDPMPPPSPISAWMASAGRLKLEMYEKYR